MTRLWMFRSVLAGTLVVSIGSSLVSQEPKSANKVKQSSVLDVGSRKQLFVDDRFIESKHGVVRRVNPPVKAGPVLTPEAKWESGRVSPYVSVLEDPTAKGRFLMYYLADPKSVEAGWEYSPNFHLCRAVSPDGIHWKRERIGKYRIDGSKDNNVVLPMEELHDNVTVFLDPLAKDAHPFKMVGQYMKPGGRFAGVYLWRSRDGIQWERLAEQALPFCSDTQNICFYDHRLKKYVAYIRAWSPRHVKRTEMADLLALPWPFNEDPKRDKKDPKEYFDKGVWRTAKNELPTVMRHDKFDPPGTDVYTNCVQLYPYADDVYVAFPSIYRHYDGYNPRGRDHRGQIRNDGAVEAQLAVSRDGVHFTRFRQPYVGLGRIGQPDGGQIYMAAGMIRRGDDLYQYYSGMPFTHGLDSKEGVKYTKGLPREVIIRVVQRLDGFVSMDAGGKGGELTTPVIAFKGSRLRLNIDCGGIGETWVELQDERGKPIQGFSMKESVSVDRNGVAQEVWWHNGPDVSSLAGRPVKMRIQMRSAKLFGFQFEQRASGSADPGTR